MVCKEGNARHQTSLEVFKTRIGTYEDSHSCYVGTCAAAGTVPDFANVAINEGKLVSGFYPK